MALDWLAGGVAGCIAKTATAPIERVKLLIQTQASNPRIVSGEVAAYSGTVGTLRRIVREQGARSLWRGNVPNCIRFFPTQAFNFCLKDRIKRSMPKYDSMSKKLAVNVGAGAVAGAGSLVFVYPLDFARTRLAADVGKDGVNREFKGLYDCLAGTMRRGGPLAVYQGFMTSLVMFSFYRGLYFGLYDTARDATGAEHPALKWGIAVTTTATAGLPVYPLDTIRRAQMMAAGNVQGQSGAVSFRAAATKIYSEAGTRGFYVGCVPNIARGMGGSVVLVLYDELTKLYKE